MYFLANELTDLDQLPPHLALPRPHAAEAGNATPRHVVEARLRGWPIRTGKLTLS